MRTSDAEAFKFAVDKGINLSVANKNGYTLMHFAVHYNNIEIVKICQRTDEAKRPQRQRDRPHGVSPGGDQRYCSDITTEHRFPLY